MILERIALYRLGRFVERVEVGLFDPGLNILAAPNEHGKSTLVRAAARYDGTPPRPSSDNRFDDRDGSNA